MKRTSHISHRKSRTGLPLTTIRVLDLTRILSGPFCTMKLGDMGAEVLKIEQPGSGDETRKWGPPFVKGESAYFLSVNRNKKSITVDMKSSEGKAIILKLAKTSDVLVENFRAGVMERLGLGYRQLKKINPRLIYCSISGYGKTSSRSHRPSFDLVVQGESGLMDVTGFPDGPPTKAGISLADVTAGTVAFEGILLALLQRNQTGKGQLVDISLLDSLLSLFAYQSQIALTSKSKVTRKGNRHPTITPYETYETSDGFINVAVATDAHWKSFCKAIKREDLAGNRQFASNPRRVENREQLERILAPILRSKSLRKWIKLLENADVPVGRINTLSEALSLGVVSERAMVEQMRHPVVGKLKTVGSPIKLSGSKRKRFSPPPLLGQHTQEVLQTLGYGPAIIRTLRARGVV